jgi:nicotinamide-nucleotide amidase
MDDERVQYAVDDIHLAQIGATMDTSLEQSVVGILTERGLTIGTAESCTGGLIAHRLTNIAGSSVCVSGGVVAYANDIKERIAGVAHETLVMHGAVSAETAAELARGARRLLKVDIAVSVTGIAGPGGGGPEKPVGLTFIGVAADGYEVVNKHVWSDTRVGNKEKSADAALRMVLDYLEAGAGTPRHLQGESLSGVDAEILPDGRVTPRRFTWQGRQRTVTSIGRQWIEGERRYVLVGTDSGDTFELSVSMPAMRWTARLVSERTRVA